MWTKYLSVAAACLLGGCAASVMDRHHFASVDPDTNEIVNIFRVTVRGDAQMANARYISGFYDQRAVDLFFNETRATSLPSDGGSLGADSIFSTACAAPNTPEDCRAALNRRLAMVPVGANAGQQGAFVMLLSTSADAIANTIGAFAENDLMVGSAMYLATRDDREEAASITARSPFVANTRAATMTELSTLAASGATATDATASGAIYLQMLNAAAAGLMPSRPPRFTNEAEARNWFQARPWENAR